MAGILVPALQVKKEIEIHRRRELPVAGEVLVQLGQEVQAADVVAQAFLTGELYILKIAENLGVEPEEVLKGLSIKESAAVTAGQILCCHSGLFGLFKSVFRAPVDGTIEFVQPLTGHVGLRTAARPLRLQAYITGRVAEIEPAKSVTIATCGAWVQGIFGVGGERLGILRALTCGPDKILELADLPEDCSGSVLIGGQRPSAAVLKKAVAAGAVGFVVGSIDDSALSEYLGFDLGIAVTGNEAVSMTVIITEGFGNLPINSEVWELAKAWDGREVSINGTTQVRAGAVRPELIIPHNRVCSVPAIVVTEQTLRVGTRVRVIRQPYFGERGVVVELPERVERIETGAEVRVLRAQLRDGRVVTVPRANVELG